MLPECRINNETFSIPKFTVEKNEVEDFIDELKGFHEEFKPKLTDKPKKFFENSF